MSDPTAVTCGHCNALTAQRRRHLRWCPTCEVFLVEHDDSWVSFAEREARQRRAANAKLVASSAVQVAAVLDQLGTHLPPGWTISDHQNAPDTLHAIAVTPPPSTVDVTAYLSPPRSMGTGGWRVNVHNRTQRIGYPLYEGGGARAASYRTALAALAAAIGAVKGDLVPFDPT